MGVLEKVLALRPTNAVARMGTGSRLPLLNPRDLVAALADAPVSLLCVPVTSTAQFAPLFRAARDEDAPIGFSLTSPPTSRMRPFELAEGLRAAAEETSHERPVFLQGGPLRLHDVSPRALAEREGEVVRLIDAGIGLLSIDASALGVDDAIAATAQLAPLAIERELSIEIAALSFGEPEDLSALLDGLAKKRVRPQFVRLRSDRLMLDAVDGEPVIHFERLEALKAVAVAQGAQLALEDRGTPPRLLSSWTAAGVKKIELNTPFAKLMLPHCLEHGLSLEDDVPLSEAIAAASASLDALAGDDRDRLEALTYAEAMDRLVSVGAEKRATAAMRHLAEHAGY